MSQITAPSQHKADILGIASSLLCVVHCLLMPVIIGLYAGLDVAAEHTHTHVGAHNHPIAWLDYVFIVISGFAVWWATRHIYFTWIKYSFYAVFTILSVALLLKHSFPIFGYVMYAASIGLIALHVLNWWRYGSCSVNH